MLVRIRPYRPHPDAPSESDAPVRAAWLRSIEYDVEIAARETTLREFREFHGATGYPVPEQPEGWTDDHPVVNVTWHDSAAFCAWRGGRLPSYHEWTDSLGLRGVVEWECATYFAKGLLPRDIRREKSVVRAVGSDPRDRSPTGVLDLVANVREWLAEVDPRNFDELGPLQLVGDVFADDAPGPFQPWVSFYTTSAEPCHLRSPSLGFRVCFGPPPPPFLERAGTPDPNE